MRNLCVMTLACLATACTGTDDRKSAAHIPAPTEVMAVQTPPPLYPTDIACTGGEGTSTLRVVVGPAGRVSDVRVVNSSGFAPLDQAAMDAVEGWQFRAATRAGQPVAATIQVPVTFRLPAELPTDCFVIQERLRRGG